MTDDILTRAKARPDDDPLIRADYCRQWGNFDNLHDQLAAALAAERAETARLRAAVERVRAVHRRGIYTATGNAFCFACEDEYGRKPWPCPTIAALEAPGGEQ